MTVRDVHGPVATARHACLECDRSFEVHAYLLADVEGLNRVLTGLIEQHDKAAHPQQR